MHVDMTNYMDMDEFREVGLLQEANRRFFHLMGFALEWSPAWDMEALIDHVHDAGIAIPEDDIRKLAELLGLDKARLSGVWDYRGERMTYADGVVDPDKIVKVDELIEICEDN